MSAAQGFSWPTAALPKILRHEEGINLNEDQQSWLVTLVFLGNVISPLPSGYIMNLIGRKTTLLTFSTVAIASWIIIYFDHSAPGIYAARVLIGFWAGLVYTIVPVFIGEVVDAKIRGTASTLYSVMLYVGSLYEAFVGPFVDYDTLALVSGIVPFIVFIALLFVPESPYYYLLKDNKEAARESLTWLRGGDVSEALEKMEKSVKEKMQQKGTVQDIFKTRAARRSFTIACILGIVQRGAGLTILFAYSTAILPNSWITPEMSAVVLNIVWVVSCFCASLIMDQFGRRKLFFVSCFGSALGMTSATIWFYLRDETPVDVNDFHWIPLVSLIFQGLFYSLGLVSIPQTMQGELFPVNIKGVGSACAAIVMAVVSGVGVKIFYPVKNNIGMYFNLLICAVCCFLGALFAATFMVETKKRTLEEIQTKLETKGKKVKEKTEVVE